MKHPPETLNTRWLRLFHDGARDVLEGCYRDHAPAALAAARRIVTDVDAETVTHEVFYRLLSDAKMRESFSGGDLGAWIARVATNAAIDLRRRLQRETDLPADSAAPVHMERDATSALNARILLDAFERDVLPEKYRLVYEARFVRQVSQRQAASELRMQRTTLVYQEAQVLRLLREFLLPKGTP